MPVVGLVGSTFAMATPAGGGVVYFPFLTLLNFPAESAVALNLGVQSFSMAIFGTVAWLRTSRDSIIIWVVVTCAIAGWVGSFISVGFPISQDIPLRIMFTFFCFFLLCYLVYMLRKGEEQEREGSIKNYQNWKTFVAIVLFGLFGGIVVGYIGVGIDMIIFTVLNALFQVDSRKSTGTSILVMGWTSVVPALVHILHYKDMIYPVWIMIVGGTVIGARLGTLMNNVFGKRRIIILFCLLLTAEVIRTPIDILFFE
eukprot:TRINITY_DN8210_c0_g1_i2.p1 TRINITY_DN8210_c0_g1~~TRINITY_DN8210_c0_g1_i2.p1  ORF type:complete len:256 (+),score=33.02 TRINITY_DN8210_c0_g1_i2:231-998(+)